MIPIVSLFTLFTELMVGKAQAKRLEENLRNCRNCKQFYSLLAGAAAINSRHNRTEHHTPARDFQVEIICAFRTKVARDKKGTL